MAETPSSRPTTPEPGNQTTVGSTALLPEPFEVDVAAVNLAAAAARAALRRTSGAIGRHSQPVHPPLLDPFLSASEPLKTP